MSYTSTALSNHGSVAVEVVGARTVEYGSCLAANSYLSNPLLSLPLQQVAVMQWYPAAPEFRLPNRTERDIDNTGYIAGFPRFSRKTRYDGAATRVFSSISP